MKSEYVRVVSLLVLFGLFTVPSLAFAGEGAGFCYKTDLIHEGLVVGNVKLTGQNNKYTLEVEIEDFVQSGDFEVLLFKDYYSDFLAGITTLDENGNGKAVFQIPFNDPDFMLIIEGFEHRIVSGEWIECEMPTKPVHAKISPSVLNLNSNGKWVTVKVSYPLGEETPTGIVMMINGMIIDPSMVRTGPNHVVLKFSRAELREYSVPGENTVTISFDLGEHPVELRDDLKVINEGKTPFQVKEKTRTSFGRNKPKLNNGKAHGKNK